MGRQLFALICQFFKFRFFFFPLSCLKIFGLQLLLLRIIFFFRSNTCSVKSFWERKTMLRFRQIRLSPIYKSRLINFRRFNSTNSKKPKAEEEDNNNNNNNDKSLQQHNVPARQDDKTDVGSFKIKPATSRSAPAPMENTGIEQLMHKDNKPYIPKLQHKRVSFEYPNLPNQDEYTNLVEKPKSITRWTRYIPKILTVIVLVWSGYTYHVWMTDTEEGEDSSDLLNPNEFHKFIVTHKEKIDDDHYIIELTPKFSYWEYSHGTDPEGKSLWNGDKFWSVEIKQPDINVVRSYTPLPLYYLKSEYTRSGEREPLLKVINPEIDEYDKHGTMCLYIKRYNDGEVSRYITDRNIGDELELRGPNIEFKFPYHPLHKLHKRPIFKDLPSKVEADNMIETVKRVNNLPDVDNIVFYAAGTGIAPILQVLFSKKPYLGHVDIHYSARHPGELGILQRFLFFLDKLDRINITYHYDDEPKTILNAKDINPPGIPNYITPKTLEEKSKFLTGDEIEQLRLQKEQQDQQNEKSLVGSDMMTKLVQKPEDRGEVFESGLHQASKTIQIPKKPASLAIVCGPDGFIDYVAGAKDLVRNKQGPVNGLLGDKKWDNSNVYKL